MNVERLLEFIEEILKLEAQHTIQRKLSKLDGAVNAIMGNPQDPNQQTGVRQRLTELNDALVAAQTAMSPAAWRFLGELEKEWTFDTQLAAYLEGEMNKNGMTPAVVKQMTENRLAERQKMLDLFNKSQDDLKGLGFKPSSLQPGETQIGFTIPRDLFDNTLRKFSRELRDLDRVLGVFAEAVDGEIEHPTLAQLSTSDPLVLVTANAPVIFAIGYAIKFFIARWAEVENIRKVREETKALKINNDAAIKAFDEAIKEKVDSGIDEQVKRLMDDSEVGRDKEMENGLRWAMRYLMSRVERGMTVEIKFLPPPLPPAPFDAESGAPTPPPEPTQFYKELGEIQHHLLFNEVPSSGHLLSLEAPLTAEPEEPPKKKRAPRKRRAPSSDDAQKE